MVSPAGVTRLSKSELCSEESHAASNLKMTLSSATPEPDIAVDESKYSPGNSPKLKTLPSKSSSMSDSGVTLKFIQKYDHQD